MSNPTHIPPRTTTASGRRRPVAMLVGLALTVLATLAPVVDIVTVDTLTDHVRDAYPAWGPHLVAGDRNAMVIYLLITGGMGILTWLWTIWAVSAGKRWAGAAVMVAFVAGACLALIDLTLGGGRYDVILPFTYGALALLPCVPGLITVVSVRRHGSGSARR